MRPTSRCSLLLSLAACAAPEALHIPGPLAATLAPEGAALHTPQGGTLAVTFLGLGRAHGGWEDAQPAAATWGGCAPVPEPDGSCARQLRYARAPGVAEWWVPRGDKVQQGWTLDRAPAGSGPLHLEVAFPGARALRLAPDAAHITAEDGGRWRYADLLAWDTHGTPLPLWLAPGSAPDRLHLVLDDRGAAWPVTIDPIIQSEADDFSAADTLTGDRFGAALAAAGDVNGDGFEDLLVGAPDHLIGKDSEANEILGAAYLYYGALTGLNLASEQKLPAPLGQGFASAVTAAGDINGDGYDDILVAAAEEYLPEGSGKKKDTDADPIRTVYAYYGGAGGVVSGTVQVLEGLSSAGFGDAIAGLGDINGDGYADVAVGAPEEIVTVMIEDKGEGKGKDKGPTTEARVAGAVHIYLGSAGGLDVAGAWVLSAAEPESYARYGGALSRAGDIDGDGYADVLVGVPSYNGSSYNLGGAYVYYGDAAGLQADREDFLLDARAFNSDAVGLSVAGGVDLNGDGLSDVVLGSDDDTAYVYYGTASGIGAEAEVVTVDDVSPLGDSFAAAVAGTGDIDGDGYDDVVFGAPEDNASDEGAAYVFRGGADGISEAGTRLTTSHKRAYNNFGIALAGLDVSGDGLEDVLVGAPGNGAGTVHLFLGEADADGDGLGASADCDDADAGVGGPVTLYADADGDGYGDLFENTALCPPVEGYVTDNDDCNDSDPEISPAAAELCEDGVDQNCDGQEDACPDEDGDDPAPSGDSDSDGKGCSAVPGSRSGPLGGAVLLVLGLAAGRRRQRVVRG